MIDAGLFKAVPLDVLSDPAKLSYILDRLVEHETEWSEFQKGRREIASYQLGRHYTDPGVHVLEIWRVDAEPELCGLVGFTDILPNVDAQMHPVFFDGKLRNLVGKRELLLRIMDWAFGAWTLHRLSVTMPETCSRHGSSARALATKRCRWSTAAGPRNACGSKSIGKPAGSAGSRPRPGSSAMFVAKMTSLPRSSAFESV